MGREGKRGTTFTKKLLFAALAAAFGLLVLEGVAWLVDLQTGYHGKVVRALDRIEPQSGPIPVRDDLDWPDGVLEVRSAVGEESLERSTMLGGSPIPGGSVVPATVPYAAAKARTDSRRKVFLVGGSAAFGYPFAYARSSAALLQESLGDRDFLVVNACRLGWSSGHLVPMVERIAAEFAPDTVILYLGNNEWSRWMPKDDLGVSPVLLRLYRRLSVSRLASLGIYWRVKSWERAQGVGREAGDDEFASHRELTGYEYALLHPAPGFDKEKWEAARASFLDNFEKNLRTMIGLARSGGARVLLCTVPYRYRLSPAWKHRQPLVWDERNREAVTAALEGAVAGLERGDPAAAIGEINRALALEPRVPVLLYVKARALERSGLPADAEQCYARAREAMIGNLGSPESLNRRIREIAREEQVTLVDIKAAFDRHQHARGVYFNRDLIVDDCHPTSEGQRLIAEELRRHFE